MTPPVARVDVVRDTYFGTTVEDPYRWLEDWRSEEALAYVRAQGAYSRAYLDSLPDRVALAERIAELSGASTRIDHPILALDHTFYLRRDPGDNLAKLMLRVGHDGDERLLFNPNTLPGSVHTAIDWYAPSRDGRYVALGTSQGGSEDSTLEVLDTETGAFLDDRISRTRFGGVSWLEDGRSFVYHRLAELPEGAPGTERYNNSRTFLHRLGSDPETDLPVFGRGLHDGVDVAPGDWPLVSTTPGCAWMVGLLAHGVLNELTLYTAPIASLADPANIPWRKVVDIEDDVTGFSLADDTLYLLTHRDAPRFKVTALAIGGGATHGPALVVPESGVVIQEVQVAGDYLLTRDLDGGIGRLRRTPREGGAPQPIGLPVEGAITALACAPDYPEFLVQLTSWTVSPLLYRGDAATGALLDTGWQPPSPVDFGDVDARELQAPAADGTVIPLSIIHRRGLRLDGANPTLLVGYGSYGLTLDPAFNPSMLAWYERGGVFAVAHLRGGGEYGEEWHRAGQKLTKENTITDFIACAEYLIREGYTRPVRLAGEGTSAGGIPSGGALVRRPDLWAAMVMRVAVTNMLRSEISENGPPNVPEFGSVTTEEGFRALQLMDSYARVQDGVAYPAVLLTTGLNDPRVDVWEASKMCARLQAATTSGRPVLLRVEEQGGHGMGSTRRQLDEELADTLAFLLEQCRV